MANEMRDRLRSLLLERGVNINTTSIADHLIGNGVVVPPCKVGETLHLVQIDFEGNYFMTTVTDVSKITMLSILRAYEEKTVVYMTTDKEQAEQKLKEMRGK